MPNAQEKSGEGTASKKEKCTVNVTATDCNYHVTPFCKKLYGSLDYYYDEKKNPENKEKNKEDKEKKEEDKEKNRECSGFLSRHFDFLDRHQNCCHQVPDYYKDYGYKYVNILTHQLGAIVSDKGKDWIDKARYLLQDYMEDGFNQNMKKSTFRVYSKESFDVYYDVEDVAFERLELNNKIFKKFAFDTHPLAYVDAGIHDISMGDKIFLLALLHEELSDPTTQEQMWRIAMDGANRKTDKYANDIVALIMGSRTILRDGGPMITKIKLDSVINKPEDLIGEPVNIDGTETTIDGKVLFAIYTKEELQELHRLREIIDKVILDMEVDIDKYPITRKGKSFLYMGMKVMYLLDSRGIIKETIKEIRIAINEVKVVIMSPYNAGYKVADHVVRGMDNVVDAARNGDGSVVSNVIEFYGDAINDIRNHLIDLF